MSLLAKWKVFGREKSSKSLELKTLNSQPKSGLLVKASWVSKSVHLTNRRLTGPRIPYNTTTTFEPRRVNNTTLNATVLSHPRHGDDGGRGPCPVVMALGTQLLYLADTSPQGPGPQCTDRSSRRWDVHHLCSLTFSCWQATGLLCKRLINEL